MNGSTTYHLCQSVSGPLMNWKAKDWKQATKWMTHNDGSRYSPDDLKREFLKLHAEGNEVIPIGECDNFDPKTGCKGHPNP